MIALILFLLFVIFLPTAYIIYDVHTDPYWIKQRKDREDAFKQYGEYPPEVHVDFWGNKSIDQNKLLRWIIKTGQFKQDMIQSHNKLRFEWVENKEESC